MRKALGGIKARLKEATRSPSPTPTATLPVGTNHLSEQYRVEANLYRYRKQRGVNLGTCRLYFPLLLNGALNEHIGSWFVLERWISEAPFRSAQAPAQSDLDVAKGDNARKILEQHWDSWITEDDWKWLSEKGINTVRIPVSEHYEFCAYNPFRYDPIASIEYPC